MVLEKELFPYWTWLLVGPDGGPGALARFLITVAVFGVAALVVGFVVALVRYGPLKAGDLTYNVVATGLYELAHISARRIWALAKLAIQESLRGRVAVALAVFFLILLFASWFLKTDYQEPARLYLSFVLTATTYLVLLIALLLSAFSLPNDFKNKTIHTIVTKPVRAGDIILGRILGFTLVGTALLLVMAVCSYVFVIRALNHVHLVDVASLENIYDADGNVIGRKGVTTLEQYHRHAVEMDAEGYGDAAPTHDHRHEIRPSDSGEYVVFGPLDYLRARVPHRGKLRFLDRKGSRVEKGINVGNEWTYRSFIAGGSQAAAIWTFANIDESKLRTDPNGNQYLDVELIVDVFRTYKGDIERGIEGSVQLRNPDPDNDTRSDLEIFTAQDMAINLFAFPRKLYSSDQQPIDLLEDLVDEDGRIEVRVQCLEGEQYYGFAQADCYVGLPDASAVLNFFSAYVSVWVQMTLVIAIGVTCSTFLNGPVAMMFTVSFITLGFFRDFFVNVAQGTQVGGGPVESLVRLVTQKNLIIPLEDTFGTHLVKAVDAVLETGMLSVAQVLPDFRSFSTVNYVASGFDIPGNQIAQNLTVGVAFVLGMFVAGYFFLRMREVAK